MRVVVSSHARFHVAFVFHTLSLAVLLSDLSINHMFFLGGNCYYFLIKFKFWVVACTLEEDVYA